MERKVFIKAAVVLLAATGCFWLYSGRLEAKEKKSAENNVSEQDVAVDVGNDAQDNQAALPEDNTGAPQEAPKVEVSEFQQNMNEAADLAGKQDYDGAIQKLQAARALEPKNSAPMRQIVDMYYAKADDENAKASLLEILKTEDYPDLRDWAERKYYDSAAQKEGIDAAIKTIEDAAGSNKNSIGVQQTLAEGYVRLRDWGKASEIYETLLKAKPGDHVISTRLVDFSLAQKNFDRVIALLEPEVKASPTDVAKSDALCHAYVGAGKQKEALDLYKIKIANKPNSPGLIGRYAQALMDFGNDTEALVQYRKAFSLDPSNLFFKQRVGEILLQQGKTPEAKKEFEELNSLAPSNQPWFKDKANEHLKTISGKK